jgi:hypothetical protein
MAQVIIPVPKIYQHPHIATDLRLTDTHFV